MPLSSSGGFFGSLEDAFKSILGQKNDDDQVKRPTAAQIAHAKAAKAARQEKLAEWKAAHAHPRPHAHPHGKG